MEDLVGVDRYHHYFSVHETEAWLLSDPSIFDAKIQSDIKRIKKAPEMVNFDEPPAKLLARLYKDKLNRTYGKVLDGRNLFSKLSSEVAYAKCPYLKLMLDDMLGMAKQAGL